MARRVKNGSTKIGRRLLGMLALAAVPWWFFSSSGLDQISFLQTACKEELIAGQVQTLLLDQTTYLNGMYRVNTATHSGAYIQIFDQSLLLQRSAQAAPEFTIRYAVEVEHPLPDLADKRLVSAEGYFELDRNRVPRFNLQSYTVLTPLDKPTSGGLAHCQQLLSNHERALRDLCQEKGIPCTWNDDTIRSISSLDRRTSASATELWRLVQSLGAHMVDGTTLELLYICDYSAQRETVLRAEVCQQQGNVGE